MSINTQAVTDWKRDILAGNRLPFDENSPTAKRKRCITNGNRGIFIRWRGILGNERGMSDSRRGITDGRRGFFDGKRGIFNRQRGISDEERGKIKHNRAICSEIEQFNLFPGRGIIIFHQQTKRINKC